MNEFIEDLFKPGFLEQASKEERRQEDSLYEEDEPEYQGCRNKNHDDWDMRESDYL